jgi:hypothetical protein
MVTFRAEGDFDRWCEQGVLPKGLYWSTGRNPAESECQKSQRAGLCAVRHIDRSQVFRSSSSSVGSSSSAQPSTNHRRQRPEDIAKRHPATSREFAPTPTRRSAGARSPLPLPLLTGSKLVLCSLSALADRPPLLSSPLKSWCFGFGEWATFRPIRSMVRVITKRKVLDCCAWHELEALVGLAALLDGHQWQGCCF